MQDVDVAVIGAGAAGVGAGLALAQSGLSYVILEAANRIGGRAYTDRVSMPFHWDQGCHWLHCADVNPLVAWADKLGARYLSPEEDGDFYHSWFDGRWADAEERRVVGAEIDGAFTALYAAAGSAGDVAISEILPETTTRNPRVRLILQLMASEDPERVSASGYCDYHDTEANWPVTSGYGDLIERMARGLNIRTGHSVSRVDDDGNWVRLATKNGDLRARAVIITVSTNVLASGAIAVNARDARPVLDAVEGFPCGSYEKVCLSLRRPVPGLENALFFEIEPDGKPPVSFQVSSWNENMLIGHVGGSIARELAEAGAQTLEAFVRERVATAFGSGFEAEIEQVATTGWQCNPLVLGAYSACRPGYAQIRRDAISAHTGRVAFAGEAFSLGSQATAHGAYQSGQDVAKRLISEEFAGGASG